MSTRDHVSKVLLLSNHASEPSSALKKSLLLFTYKGTGKEKKSYADKVYSVERLLRNQIKREGKRRNIIGDARHDRFLR